MLGFINTINVVAPIEEMITACPKSKTNNTTRIAAVAQAVCQRSFSKGS